MGSSESGHSGFEAYTNHLDKAELIFRHFIAEGDVISEGLVLATRFPFWLPLTRECGASPEWAFLDTPSELAVQRVFQRNGGQPFKTELVDGRRGYCSRLISRLPSMSAKGWVLHHESALEELVRWCRERVTMTG